MTSLELFTQDDISEFLTWLENTDEDFLVQFAGTNFRYPLDESQLVQTLNDNDTIMFKSLDGDGNMIGHCQLLRVDHILQSATIGRVMVKPEYRDNGHGKTMVKTLMDYTVKELGIRKLILRVFDFNERAISCYTHLGFVEIAREAVYYPVIHKTWYRITMEWIG